MPLVSHRQTQDVAQVSIKGMLDKKLVDFVASQQTNNIV